MASESVALLGGDDGDDHDDRQRHRGKPRQQVDQQQEAVLNLNPEKEPTRAKQALASHLVRAKWMTEHGYRLLLSVDREF